MSRSARARLSLGRGRGPLPSSSSPRGARPTVVANPSPRLRFRVSDVAFASEIRDFDDDGAHHPQGLPSGNVRGFLFSCLPQPALNARAFPPMRTRILLPGVLESRIRHTLSGFTVAFDFTFFFQD